MQNGTFLMQLRAYGELCEEIKDVSGRKCAYWMLSMVRMVKSDTISKALCSVFLKYTHYLRYLLRVKTNWVHNPLYSTASNLRAAAAPSVYLVINLAQIFRDGNSPFCKLSVLGFTGLAQQEKPTENEIRKEHSSFLLHSLGGSGNYDVFLLTQS